MLKYISVFNETRVKGFYDKDELSEAIFDLEWGEDYKVYKTSDVLNEIKNSHLDAGDKQSLTKRLNKDDIDFEITTELEDILSEMDHEIEF
jgi:hypothetical protein